MGGSAQGRGPEETAGCGESGVGRWCRVKGLWEAPSSSPSPSPSASFLAWGRCVPPYRGW